MAIRRGSSGGARFIFLSLIVTTVSIIFFFAGRHFFPTIKEGVISATQLLEAAADGGGFRVESIDINLSGPAMEKKSVHTRMARHFVKNLERDLKSFEGQFLWAVDLDEVKETVLRKAWAKSVNIRRSVSGALVVDVNPRKSALLARAEKGWVVIDDEGFVISRSVKMSGDWVQLPIVYGFEKFLGQNESEELLNRRLGKDRWIFADLVDLIRTLKDRVGLSVDSARIEDDDWKQQKILEVAWLDSAIQGKTVQRKAQFFAGEWEKKLESLQFILSDIEDRNLGDLKILGQFEDKWFVQPAGGENL